MSGRPSRKSAEIGLFRPFSAFFALFRRVRRAPGKSRKRRKKAFFLRYPRISLNPHLLNPHLRHSKSFVWSSKLFGAISLCRGPTLSRSSEFTARSIRQEERFDSHFWGVWDEFLSENSRRLWLFPGSVRGFSRKTPRKPRENCRKNFPESRNATNSRISGTGKGKPAGNLGPTLPEPCPHLPCEVFF